MKFVLFVLLALAGPQASALDVNVDCTPKFYSCAGTCMWQTGVPVPSTQVLLTKDPNYPNKNYPFNVHRGTFRATYDNHTLTLDIIYREAKNSDPLDVHAMLSTPGVAAETSGIHSIDISLRNANYGRGFNCWVVN